MTTANTNNLTIGQAEIYFADNEANNPNVSTPMADPTSFGNITVAEISPDVTYVDHFISVRGNRRKDKSVAVTKTLTVPFTFDELSVDNVRRFVLGSDVATGSTVTVLTKEKYEGRAILNFQTDVGQNFIYVIPKCLLKTDGGISMDTDDWMNGNFMLEILYHDTYRVDSSPSLELAPYGYIDFDETTIGSPF